MNVEEVNFEDVSQKESINVIKKKHKFCNSAHLVTIIN